MKACPKALLFVQVLSSIYCKSCVHRSLPLKRCRFLWVFGKNALAESWGHHPGGGGGTRTTFSPGGRAGICTPAGESAIMGTSARLIWSHFNSAQLK